MLRNRTLTRVLVIDDQEEVRTWVRGVPRSMGITDVVEEEPVIEATGVLARLQGLRMVGIVPKPLATLQPLLDRLAEAPGNRVEERCGTQRRV